MTQLAPQPVIGMSISDFASDVPVAPTVRTAAPARSDSGLRDRVPAQSLIEQVVARGAAFRAPTRLERLVGRDAAEAELAARVGAVARERAVATVLAGLPLGWTVLHSLPIGSHGEDIDHVVVGPGGVVTITVTHPGDDSFLVAAGGVLVAGSGRSAAVRAEAEARRADHVLAGSVLEVPAVKPVVVVVGALRVAGRSADGGVSVVRADRLVALLAGLPVRLNRDEIAAVVARLEQPESWQPTRDAAPELLVAYARTARRLRLAHRVRTAWAGGALTAAAAAAALLGPVLLGR